MQNAMFSGVFAALTTEHRMAAISNNMANVTTTGYKQDLLAFRDTMYHFAHDYIREPLEHMRHDPLFPAMQNRARVRIAEVKTDFSQGSMVYTGNALDVAIAGEGFFRMQTPYGEFLSRNGNFCQNADGTLVSKQGYVLEGEAGPIQIPQGTRNIHIDSSGGVYADDALIGRIALISYDKLEALEKIGDNLYRVAAGFEVEETDPRAAGSLINQGYSESANVNTVTEMVNMIEVQRHFEAIQKVMQSSDAFDREAISKVARPR